jgi:RNA polymerase sigma-70 factor (ECF subfamily)
MDNPIEPSADEISRLGERMRTGDRAALGSLFEHYRERLLRMVDIRLDGRVRARIDPADVVQDAFLDAARSLDDYVRNPKVPPFLWLRLVVGERIAIAHRQHLGARMRDAAREVSLYREPLPEASTAALASMLLGRLTTPTQAAQRAERLLRIQEALNALDPIDREVLALRHFEQLNRAEAAQALGISEEAGAKRYIRALKRLKDVMAKMPGGLEGF